MIVEDRHKISELLLRGHRNRSEIARIINQGRDADLHISPSQVGKDIASLEQTYMEQTMENIEVYRARALDELYYLLSKCYEGWEKSKINKITIESMKEIEDETEYDEIMNQAEVEQGDLNGVNVFGRSGKIKEEGRGEGNVAFLNAAKGILDSINKIKGVDGVNKLALTDPSGTQEYTGVAELMKARMNELSGRKIPTDTNELLLAPPPKVEEEYIDAEEELIDE